MTTEPIGARGARPWPNADQRLLLGAALGAGDAAARDYAAWRAATDLDAIDSGSFRLLPLLYRNLARQGLLADDPIAGRLKGIYRLSWVRNRAALTRLQGVVGHLLDAGIGVQLLKGAALILRHYRDYGARWMDDCDLLVRPEQAPRAMALLRELGWRPDLAAPERIIPVQHSTNFANDLGSAFDLHWRPLWECYDPADDACYWAVATPERLGDLQVLAPAPDALLLYICVHGLRWNVLPPFRWIADALVILRDVGDDLDWDRFVHLAQRLRLTVPAHAALYHLRGRWGAAIPDAALRALRETHAPPTLRLEYVVKLMPRRFWPKAVIEWSHARRSVGYEHVGRALLAFPVRMQHFWQLESPVEVPRRALAAAVFRATRRNRAVI